MGQYHKIVNLDKFEYISPDGLGVGVKALEQLCSAASTQEALFMLLMCSNGRGGGDVRADDPHGMIGRWAGDRIAVVGDYAEDGDIPGVEAGNIYGRCSREGAHPLRQLAGAADDDPNPHWKQNPDTATFVDISPLLRPLMEETFSFRYEEKRMGSYVYFDREFEDEGAAW